MQNSGNAVDMTIRNGGSVIAAYGSGLQTDWRTSGVCTIQLLTTSSTIDLYLQSGGSSDCILVCPYSSNIVLETICLCLPGDELPLHQTLRPPYLLS